MALNAPIEWKHLEIIPTDLPSFGMGSKSSAFLYTSVATAALWQNLPSLSKNDESFLSPSKPLKIIFHYMKLTPKYKFLSFPINKCLLLAYGIRFQLFYIKNGHIIVGQKLKNSVHCARIEAFSSRVFTRKPSKVVSSLHSPNWYINNQFAISLCQSETFIFFVKFVVGFAFT